MKMEMNMDDSERFNPKEDHVYDLCDTIYDHWDKTGETGETKILGNLRGYAIPLATGGIFIQLFNYYSGDPDLNDMSYACICGTWPEIYSVNPGSLRGVEKYVPKRIAEE